MFYNQKAMISVLRLLSNRRMDGAIRIYAFCLIAIVLPGCGYYSKVSLYSKEMIIYCEKKHKDGGCEMRTEPVYGRVIDRQTGDPLADVIVMGFWPKSLTRYFWRTTVGVAHLAETLSDPSGSFEIPACAPPCRVDGYFAPYQPDILFYKEGYYPRAISNMITDVEFDVDLAAHRRWKWDWNGEVIELEPVNDKKNDPRLKAAYTLSPRLYLNDNCNWMKIPNTLMFKTRQMQRRETDPEKAAMTPERYLTDNYLRKQKNCHPDPASYLTEAPRHDNE
ncbi:MAG: hypothetical protein KZQ81_04460 [Candidatus Thiodiazotropha sp. (ex Rostrolucina anterorostrata)]|nr:hypothetical protein [Candidatus Thiodiazotropha sp. (ex Rostrolucina anterorostrata)]